MSLAKKTTKSKFMSEDFEDYLNDSQFLKKSPKKKAQKRSRDDAQEDISIAHNSATIGPKKMKTEESADICRESRQKLLNVMKDQNETRKQTNENLLKSLMEVVTQLEADYNVLKDNEQKLEHLTGSFIKCIQQTTNAHKDKLKTLKEIHSSFKKEVEGLLTRGAMKVDDRPLWFDVYKAFPPNAEPKFARPKPEEKPIRQILYKEDVIRAKFHGEGHGIGINMLSPYGETQIKRLIQQHEKLKSEGVPENELIEKSVAAVSTEREIATKITPKNSDSVTAQVLAEADIKNIFKE